MSGATKNYKFGRKNNWRRWMWNRISERLLVQPRDAVVIYLAGSDDLDRNIAIEHGFRPQNLIAVERDLDAARILRERGVDVICGDIESVINEWNAHRRIDVLYGDFCGGLTIARFEWLTGRGMLQPAVQRAVVAFNLMAGREFGWKKLSNALNVAALSGKIYELPSHRGRAAADMMLGGMTACIFSQGSEPLRMYEENPGFAAECDRKVFDHMSWAFSSYVSDANLRFDSVVMRNPWGWTEASLDADEYNRVKARVGGIKERKLRMHIAAKLAVRTMRISP